MSIRKQNTAGGQAVEVRSRCLRMTTQATNPVIQIVDRNEENVRFAVARLSRVCSIRREANGREQSEQPI